MDEKNSISIFQELIKKQRIKCKESKKFTLNDIKRVAKHIDTSIFDKNKCSLWTGFVTNKQNNKICYINFYFRHRKVALHRLLYINYVTELSSDQYIKFTCDNKGICCNINHMTTVNKNNSNKSKNNDKSIDKLNFINDDDLDSSLVVNLN